MKSISQNPSRKTGINKKATIMFSVALMLMAVPFVSMAAAPGTFGEAASSFRDQFGSFADLAITASFFIGIIVALAAGLKIKKYSDNPQQESIAKPITYVLVAAILIGLPAFITMSVNSTLGSGASTGSIEGSGVYGEIGN